MRVPRFKDFLVGLLDSSGHPGVQEIGSYYVPRQDNPVVKCVNGAELYLTIVGTSPPGGDSHADPEKVVTREPGQPIVVTNREDP